MSVKLIHIETDIIPDEYPDISYLEQEDFKDRLEEYEAGHFNFIGIRARSEIEVNGVLQTITSSGLWGIEDDSSEEYINEIRQEQIEELKEILEELRKW